MGLAAFYLCPGRFVHLVVRIADACLDRQSVSGKKPELGAAGIYFLISMPYFEIKMFEDHVAGLRCLGQARFDGHGF